MPGKTLLFIDEIQACPDAINKLRYFYEQYPELHLIAAGSLLEFVLAELPSFGVGRVRSVFVYPLSFEEFLCANGEDMLVSAYKGASPTKPLFDVVHNRLLQRYRTFLLTGGMPKVVRKYVDTNDLRKCQPVLTDLVVSYRDDFKKYRKRIPEERLSTIFEAVARQQSGRFVYSNVNDNLSLSQVKFSLDLLIKAGLVYPIVHTTADGIPLYAEINERYQRMVVFDTGVLLRMMGVSMASLYVKGVDGLVNKDALAEAFVATELVKNASCYEPSRLFCWHREKKDSQAEVDFVVQCTDRVVPVEVKSGTKGSMQSLRIFMGEKGSDFGVRTSLENFSLYGNIRVFPLYAISNILRFDE
ncbi:MAG: ATP-binding protein [Paludibacteraceae bacterium]|nr:ATP-binding protein [Paludibacteraceae bacterium]